MSKASSKSGNSGVERRRARRRPILSTFSVFVVIPKKGMHRLQVHDISELGVGFDLDLEGEEASGFRLQMGEPLDLRFYLNQSLFIPLSIQVARVDEKGTVRRVGAEFEEKNSQAYQAFAAFLQMLDKIADIVQVDAP